MSLGSYLPSAIQGHTLNWHCQFNIFFWKAIQFNNFILDLIFFQSKIHEFLAMLILFDNFLTINQFSNSKMIIYCFKSINIFSGWDGILAKISLKQNEVVYIFDLDFSNFVMKLIYLVHFKHKNILSFQNYSDYLVAKPNRTAKLDFFQPLNF